MQINKALYVSQEISPYLPSTQMSLLCRLLPQGVQEGGAEVRTFMPRYGCINERRNQLHEVIRLSGLNIPINDTDHPLIIKVATLQGSRMQVYFIDSDDYFKRHTSKGLEIDIDPKENNERLIFFARGVIETVKKLRWNPDLIQCAGWISALVPLYLRKYYNGDPILRDAKIVYSLFNTPIAEPLRKELIEELKMDNFTDHDLEPLIAADEITQQTLHTLAMLNSDAIIQAQPDIDPELLNQARQSGKPFMEFPGQEDYMPAYLEFYKNL